MMESRKIRLSNIVLTEDLAKQISDVLQDISTSVAQEGSTSRPRLSYSITGSNETSYESDSVEVFDQPLGVPISEMVMFLSTYDDLIRVRLKIDAEDHGRSSISIGGQDTQLVNHATLRIQNILQQCDEPPWLIRNARGLCKIGSVALLVVAIGVTLNLLLKGLIAFDFIDPTDLASRQEEPTTPEQIEQQLLLIIVILSGILTFVFGFGSLSWVDKLWPDVELQIGAKKYWSSQKRRRRMGAIFTLIGLPILFEIILRVL